MLGAMADQLSTLSKRVNGLMSRAHSDLADLVALSSVHDDPGKRDDCRASAAWVRGAFSDAGIDSLVMDTSDGSQTILGYQPGPPGSPTVLLYSHHDVQPAGPRGAMGIPVHPHRTDGRWYGRGAADCKGNVVAQLTALRAVREATGALPVGVQDHDRGLRGGRRRGPGPAGGRAARDVGADMILIADTGNVAVGRPTLTTACAGWRSVRVSS